MTSILRAIGNKSAKNYNTINLLFKTAISILVISNHNSFRLLLDKMGHIYFRGPHVIRLTCDCVVADGAVMPIRAASSS